VFAFGDAAPHGNTVGIHLNSPIVGIAATPDGTGYWLVGADAGSSPRQRHILWLDGWQAPQPAGRRHPGDAERQGLLAGRADGGVFDFGGAGFFSDPALPVSGAPIIGIG